MPILNNKGINSVAAIISVMLLAIMGAGMAYMVASNQQTRIQQVTGDQAFYSVQAGLEFTLGQILEDGWTGSSITRHFSGETISVSRSGGSVTVSSSEKDAESSHSIDDPTPVSVDCLTVDTSSASIGGGGNRQLRNLTITRNASCTNTVTITSMNGTAWLPDNSELLDRIRIDGSNRFTGPSDSSGGTFDFGANDVIINDSASYPVDYIRWDSDMRGHNFDLYFNYTYEGNPYSKLVEVAFLASNQADCFDWNTANARLGWQGNRWRTLTGTTVENTCADPIIIDAITTSWSPATPARYLEQIRIAGTTLFSGSISSGTLADVNHLIAASTTQPVNLFGFDDDMLNRDYSILWTFTDGTSKTTALTLFASNQNTCLSVDDSSVGILNKDLLGLTLTNSCGLDIAMTDLELSWSADPGNRLRNSNIDDTDGSNSYNSNSSSPASVSFGTNDLYVRNEDSTHDITRFRFQSNIATGQTYTLSFTMADSTIYTTSFTPVDDSTYLTVDTSSATIGGPGDRRVLGVTLTNTGGSAITIDRFITSWSPTSGGRKISAINIDGTDVWTGNTGSGKVQDITDVTINPSQTLPLILLYNGDMSGRSFTLEIVMSDFSSVTEGPFSPPG